MYEIKEILNKRLKEFAAELKENYLKNFRAENSITNGTRKRGHGVGEKSLTTGINNEASGKYSTAEGSNTEAKGMSSHAEGSSTKAYSDYQHVEGKYNIPDSNNKFAHIVGNGTVNKANNAYVLDWNGNAEYAGSVKANGKVVDGNDLTTKDYVLDKIIYKYFPVIESDDGELAKIYLSDLEEYTLYKADLRNKNYVQVIIYTDRKSTAQTIFTSDKTINKHAFFMGRKEQNSYSFVIDSYVYNIKIGEDLTIEISSDNSANTKMNEQISALMQNKYDDISIDGVTLSLKANGIAKKSITLPTITAEALSKIDEQFNTKANKYDVRYKNVEIELGDLSQNVKEAMTNGSVAVVGKDMVGFENLNSIMKDNLGDYITQYVEIQNGYRDGSNGRFKPHDSFRCIYVDCKEGEKYMCNTNVNTSSLAIVNFYIDGTFYKSLGFGSVGVHENYEFTIPEYATQLSITSTSNYMPILKKFNAIDVKKEIDILNNNVDLVNNKITPEKMYVNIKNKDINVLQKYNSNYDVCFRIFPHGVNSLPQIATHILRPNTGKLIQNLSGFTKNLCVISTDSIGPFRGLNAKNNADGDSFEHDVWVGGSHGYNGYVDGVTAVAKNISINLYADNMLVTDENLHEIKDCAKVVVINQVQGCNTMKSDGTGRYILEEKITYTFKNLGEIKVEVEFKALEDLSINYYYGLQCPCTDYTDKILFENDNINKTYITNPFAQNYNTGNKNDSDCYKFIANKGDNYISMQLDNSYGLGRLRYNQVDKIINSITSKKAYFNLITSKVDLIEGQIMSWRGKYKFYSK